MLVPASHFYTMCKIICNTYTGKRFCWHTGGGGGGYDIFVMFSDYYIFKCKTDCSTQNFASLKHLIKKMEFTFINYSSQGSFTDKLYFLLKAIGIHKWESMIPLFILYYCI